MPQKTTNECQAARERPLPASVRRAGFIPAFRPAGRWLGLWLVICAAVPALMAQPTLTLDAPDSVRAGDLTPLTASLSEGSGSFRYRFVYSDTRPSDSDWGSRPITVRVFPNVGDVSVHVEAQQQLNPNLERGVAANIAARSFPPILRSEEKTIHVLAALPTVRLQVATKNPKVGVPVVWNVSRRPNNQPLQYEFNPGDGTDVLRSDQATVEHTYTSARTFTASVQLLGEDASVKTSARVTVAAAPAPILDPVPAAVELKEDVTFSATYPAADANTRFRFQSGDQEPPTAWSTGHSAQHAYLAEGKFAPFVEVTRGKGPNATPEARSAAREIVVRPALTITLEALKPHANVGDEAGFKVTTNRAELAPRIAVDFGDGEKPVLTDPGTVTHVFKRAASFDVTASVEGKTGRATATQRIVIDAQPAPSLGFLPPAAEINATVQFNATFRAADRRTRYRFTYGDDSAPSSWGTSPRIDYRYARAGSFPATVDVGVISNDAPNSEPLLVGTSPARDVIVRPAMAVKLVPPPGDVRAGDEVVFATTTTRPDLVPQYSFAFSDGAKIPPSSSTSASHLFLSPGQQKTSVAATTKLGPAQDEITLTVAAPVALTLKADPAMPEIDQPVTLTVGSAPAGKQFRYRFNFNDGSPPSAWLAAGTTSHAFHRSGSFRPAVELGAIRDGAVVSLTTPADVGVDVQPVLQFSLRPTETEIHAGRSTTFRVETNRPGKDLSVDLNFGDGSVSSLKPPGTTIGHTFQTQGPYQVSWIARAGRTSVQGNLTGDVLPAVPLWVFVLSSVAAVAAAGFAGHRLGWVRPSLHLKLNPRAIRVTARSSPQLELEFRLNRNLASVRCELVTPPVTPGAGKREIHV